MLKQDQRIVEEEWTRHSLPCWWNRNRWGRTCRFWSLLLLGMRHPISLSTLISPLYRQVLVKGSTKRCPWCSLMFCLFKLREFHVNECSCQGPGTVRRIPRPRLPLHSSSLSAKGPRQNQCSGRVLSLRSWNRGWINYIGKVPCYYLLLLSFYTAFIHIYIAVALNKISK